MSWMLARSGCSPWRWLVVDTYVRPSRNGEPIHPWFGWTDDQEDLGMVADNTWLGPNDNWDLRFRIQRPRDLWPQNRRRSSLMVSAPPSLLCGFSPTGRATSRQNRFTFSLYINCPPANAPQGCASLYHRGGLFIIWGQGKGFS